MRRDSNDYRGGITHEERRGLLVLSIWTMLLLAFICGSGLLAYKIYFETFSQADASVPPGKFPANPRQRRRVPARNNALHAPQNATPEPSAPGEYQVYSASEEPALPSRQEGDAKREVASARPPDATTSPDVAARHALPFVLQLNGPRVAVGPVTLRLEVSANNAPEYSVTACREDNCVLLSNLLKDQVRVFSFPGQPTQFELIITRTEGNRLSGLLTVPAN